MEQHRGDLNVDRWPLCIIRVPCRGMEVCLAPTDAA